MGGGFYNEFSVHLWSEASAQVWTKLNKMVCTFKFVHYSHIKKKLYVPRLNFYGPPKSKVYNLKQNLDIEFQALDSKFHSALEPFSPFWWSVNETQPTLRGTVSLNFPRSAVLIGEKQKLGAVSINIFHHM